MILNRLTPRVFASAAFILALFGGFNLIAQTDGFQDLMRPPDTVSAVTESSSTDLAAQPDGIWTGAGVTITTRAHAGGLSVQLAAPNAAVMSLRLHWKASLPAGWKYLGDAWERAYGDLEWLPLDGQRAMPWYFLASNGKLTHGYGVKAGKAGPGAFCYWTADDTGISLVADVRCGGSGVLLGKRKLDVCTIISRCGKPGETPFAAAQAFCEQMCPHPHLPKQPVYGFNDWYCSYGKDTDTEFLANAKYMVDLAPVGGVRPFAVVDDGWEEDPAHTTASNLWNRINPQFSTNLDMAGFARRIRDIGARPGLWCRPLIATPDCPPSWRLSRDPSVLDPTVPEVRKYVAQMFGRFHGWGYELIKHDYTTFDLLGLWGLDMHSKITTNGWAFADRSVTTAEVIRNLYLDIRRAAGKDTLILGCNTVGQLSAGIFEMQRIGDDTSGRDWDRTRKMGVNCLAFRGPQHDRFFAVDADCAGQTTADSVPWQKNSQWLKLLSQSGTVLFTSFPRNILNAEQAGELQQALNAASKPQPLGEPLDWLENRTPSEWQLNGSVVQFDW